MSRLFLVLMAGILVAGFTSGSAQAQRFNFAPPPKQCNEDNPDRTTDPECIRYFRDIRDRLKQALCTNTKGEDLYGSKANCAKIMDFQYKMGLGLPSDVAVDDLPLTNQDALQGTR